MKLNQLKAGALLSYVQAGCSVVITLAYTPLMLRLLGQSEYGVYTLASSLTAYLGLLHFGLSGSYIRFYTRYRAAGDQRGVNQLNALFLTVYAGIALLALLASVGTPAAPGAGAVILFTILSGAGFVNDSALLAYSLILAINRPIEMLVTSLNVVGDAVASICVAKSEGLLNEEKFNA